MKSTRWAACACVAAVLAFVAALAGDSVKLFGYLEYRKGSALIVDGQRVAAKYGDGSKTTNFFFGDHSLSTKRAADLEKEIAQNYADPKTDPPTRAGGS